MDPQPHPTGPAVPHIEVADPAAAFRKLEEAGKKLMAAPKNASDGKGKSQKPDGTRATR